MSKHDEAIEGGLRAFDPELFSEEPTIRHRAASPLTVEAAQAPIRERMKASISVYLATLTGEVEPVERYEFLLDSDERPVMERNPNGTYMRHADHAALQAKVGELECERGDLLDRVEELEGLAEHVSTEFEKECWVSMRALLDECKFDWRDVVDGGVTAEDAREYVTTTLREQDKATQSANARAETAEAALAAANAEIERLVEGLRPFAEQAAKFDSDPVGRCVAGDVVNPNTVSIRLGDLRRARALTEHEGGK